MMHQLLGRLAQFGGEAALYALFAISILSVAIISERAWYLARHHISAEEFARRLITLLQAGDVPRALALSQRTNVNVCSITLAALMQPGHELQAAAQALDTVALHERTRLQNKVTQWSDLPRISVLIGLAGTFSDVLAHSASNRVGESLTSGSAGTQVYQLVTASLGPAVAGLAVGITAWLATSMLRVHVQRQLFACDMIARLASSQLESQATEPGEPCESSTQAA